MKQKCILLLKKGASMLYVPLSVGFCVLFYLSILLKERTLAAAFGVSIFLGVACGFLPRLLKRIMVFVGSAGISCAAVILLLVTLCGGKYEPVQGSYAQSFYGAPSKVMVIVPHEDDDLNLAAGVIDSYRAAGTQVIVVFLSNGDYRFRDSFRLREAIRSQKVLGVPEEDVVFLGYGDQYDRQYGHLYNAPAGDVVPSHAGHTETYGLKEHPAFHQSGYTRENAIRDMQELITLHWPEVIYCVDQDSHGDHRAASLIFEEAFGNLLAEGRKYHPAVYKGFCYSTAWHAKKDYGALNVASTLQPYESGRMEETNCYLWEERLRLPVLPEDLAYTRRASRLWPAFTAYGSQRALNKMDRMVNGDKVFWRRRTDSLLYTAAFSAENKENLTCLNDFKLADSSNVADKKHRPFDSVWEAKPGASLTVALSEPSRIYELYLYDNPSLTDNVLEARITLDNGTSILTGPLEPGGGATQVSLDSSLEISSFTVEILSLEGEKAGLSEIEAYNEEVSHPGFIKLTDTEDNFLYTYTPEGEGDIGFGLYASSPEWKEPVQDAGENFTVTADGRELKWAEGAFWLPCPMEQTTVRVQLNSDPAVYDEIVVKPYSAMRSFWIPKLQSMDSMVCAFSSYTHFHLAWAFHAILRGLGMV